MPPFNTMYPYQQYYAPMPYNPAVSAQDRINNLQQHMSTPQQPNMTPVQPQGPAINARAVTSYEEAQAATINLDGTLNIFTDLGHKQIYLKQFDNTNGTANLYVFRLVENVPTPQPALASDVPPAQPEYVLKSDFDALKKQFEELSDKLAAPTAETKAEAKKGAKNA